MASNAETEGYETIEDDDASTISNDTDYQKNWIEQLEKAQEEDDTGVLLISEGSDVNQKKKKKKKKTKKASENEELSSRKMLGDIDKESSHYNVRTLMEDEESEPKINLSRTRGSLKLFKSLGSLRSLPKEEANTPVVKEKEPEIVKSKKKVAPVVKSQMKEIKVIPGVGAGASPTKNIVKSPTKKPANWHPNRPRFPHEETSSVERFFTMHNQNKKISKAFKHKLLQLTHNPGQVPKLEVWKIENGLLHQSKNDKVGQFYSGHCYLVTHTEVIGTHQIPHIHYWIGGTSGEEAEVLATEAAFELAVKMPNPPFVHRECQLLETARFRSYFKPYIMYNDGVESKYEDKKVRLFMVRQEDKVVEVVEIPLHAKNMNKGDSFVLDNGNKVFLWSGEETSVHERYTAVRVQTRLRNWRMGRAEKADAHTDEEFWTSLDGAASDIKESKFPYRKSEELNIDATTELPASLLAFRENKYEVIAEGSLDAGLIDQHFTSDAIVLYQDGLALLLWFGENLGNVTRKDAVKHAVYYLRDKGIDKSVQLSMMYESAVGKQMLKQRFST